MKSLADLRILVVEFPVLKIQTDWLFLPLSFSGSHIENWHSILRNGLVVASNTRLQVLASNYDADALPMVSGSLKRPIIKRVERKDVFYRKQAEIKCG